MGKIKVKKKLSLPIKAANRRRKKVVIAERKKLVIQGLHMVSGTRCPAGTDPVKKWSEGRAAAPKGRCPVGHRG